MTRFPMAPSFAPVMLLLLVLLSPAGVVPAAAVDGSAALSRILTDPDEQKTVLDAAGRSAVVVNNPCPTARYDLGGTVVIYRQPAFGDEGGIVSGAWKQVVREQGCGASRLLNVLVFVQSEGSVSAAPILPGTTRADPQLQKDGVGHALAAAGGREENCKVGYVSDTRFIDQEASAVEGGRSPPWRELWTLMSCTRWMEVPMLFIPDQGGTTIVAGPSTAVRIYPLAPDRR
ncbi:MAG: hypothetical protein F8N37_18425 [Telmatospirillum sp.]|nr:hypothetical protein [Telmatospirillum sp.]